MSRTVKSTGEAVVVASFGNVVRARATVRSVQADGHLACTVIDVDGAYRPVADEQVVPLLDMVARRGLGAEAAAAAATLADDEFSFYAGVLGASHVEAGGSGGAITVLQAGVHVVSDLRPLTDGSNGVLVVPRADVAGARRRAADAPINTSRDRDTGFLTVQGPPAAALFSRALYVVRTSEQIRLLHGLVSDWRVAATALDTFAVAADATVVTSSTVLVGPWRGVGQMHVDAEGRLCVDGVTVQAVDLTALDPQRPWVLDAHAASPPRVLLSDHPLLGQVVGAEASARIADLASLGEVGRSGQRTGVGLPARARLDTILRTEARRAGFAKIALPDPLDLGEGTDLEAWALALVPAGDPMPTARYLAGVRLARPDLVQAFPQVPGPDAVSLARWALKWGVTEHGLDAELLARAAELTLAARSEAPAAGAVARASGVNLVGYLSGELGLGVSARLVDAALQSVGVSTSTFDVGQDVESRQDASFRKSAPVLHDTSLLCVNAAETATVAPRIATLLDRTRVIGMWYWELEDFPKAHHGGFAHVDEVWAATDFMRDAIARHAGDVPVRTVMPPLPQAGEDAGIVPERFNIPRDRPWFLFTFDYFSTAARKNPFGLVDAFTRAFEERPTADRPLLVIKTINGGKDPVQAERLRYQIAGRADVMLIDEYLDNHERHVLVSHCTAFVSLHKAEGLGLTVAEAMAWGKPVITTAYGGVMQFCDEENSFLVRHGRGFVEEKVGPYDAGLPWAEPDLDHAAALMRAVIDDPERAAAVGAQAARDIREKHNTQVAGAHMRDALDEADRVWRAKRAAARARRQAERRDAARPTGATQAPRARIRGLGAAWRAKARRRLRATMARRVDR